MGLVAHDRHCQGTVTADQDRQTWLCVVESDITPLNIDLTNACHRAQNLQAWRLLVETAVSIRQAT